MLTYDITVFFNTIPHLYLIPTKCTLHIPLPTVKLIYSFLQNRKATIYLGNEADTSHSPSPCGRENIKPHWSMPSSILNLLPSTAEQSISTAHKELVHLPHSCHYHNQCTTRSSPCTTPLPACLTIFSGLIFHLWLRSKFHLINVMAITYWANNIEEAWYIYEMFFSFPSFSLVHV